MSQEIGRTASSSTALDSNRLAIPKKTAKLPIGHFLGHVQKSACDPPSSALLNRRRSLLRKRASLPELPQAMSSDDFTLGRFGQIGAVLHLVEELIEWGTLERERAFSNVSKRYCMAIPTRECNNEVTPYAFRYRPGKVLFPSRSARRRSPIIMEVL